MKDDWDWVTKVIKHNGNTYAHYPALKKLIKIFALKWKDHPSKRLYNLYVHYLDATLRIQFLDE